MQTRAAPQKVMKLKLVDFDVKDGSGSTQYPTVVESIGETVFDARILMFDDVDQARPTPSLFESGGITLHL